MGCLYSWGANNGCNIMVAYSCVEKKNCDIPYSEKLSRQKTFTILRFCGFLQNFSLQNLGGWHPLAAPASNLFFFLRKFPAVLYFKPRDSSLLIAYLQPEVQSAIN